jgi:hypothetical protein
VNSIIAAMRCFGQKPGEDRVQITVEIGTPYECESPGEWACPVKVEPLYPLLRDIHGIDSLQALCLAIRLAETLLTGFRDDGGTLTYENGEKFSFEPYLGRR